MKIFEPLRKITTVCFITLAINIHAQGLSVAVDGASTAQTLSVAGTASPVSCYGGSNGSISTVVSGGSPNYQYSWYDNGANTSTRSNLSAGTYTVQVKDNVNCIKVKSYTISAPVTSVSVSASASSSIICAGNSISLSASASGGTGPFTYTWNNAAGIGATVNVNPTNTTNYTVTAKDANGCTATNTKTINVNALPTAVASGGGVICTGSNLPNVIFTFTGTPPYNFSYSNGTTITAIAGHNTNTYTITNAPVGTYNVTALTDANACAATSLGGSVSVSNIATQNAPTIAFASPISISNTISVCGGTQVKMSSNTSGVAEYLWYKNGVPVMSALAPNNAYTINVSASGTTTYNLAVVYNGSQCISALSAPLTIVNATPPAVITPAGPTSFCANTPTPLNANVGTNYSYVWKAGTTIVQVGGTSYIPTSSGSYTVSIKEGITGCTQTSAAVVIGIKEVPFVDAGTDQSICAGASIQIGTTGIVTNTYTWSPSTGLSNIYVANPIASPTTTTTYTLTVTNPATGCTSTDAVLVTRLPLPPTPSLAASGTAVCEGTSITLTPTATGAVSLNWYKNGLFLGSLPPTAPLTVSTPTASTENYTLKSKGANGCLSSFSNYRNVWIKPAATPTISSSPAAVGGVVTLCVPGGTSGGTTLTANTTTASPTYSWRLGSAFIAGANANTYLANVTTTNNNKIFSVRANYSNGCTKTSANTTVKLVTIGCSIKDGSTKDDPNNVIAIVWESEVLTAYPNPTDGLLNVNIQNCEAKKAKILLYNALGQVVAERSISITNGKASETLDLREMAKGVYTLSFQTEEGQKVQKVIKE